jgi:DNA-binding PadR family transcriptional regulator
MARSNDPWGINDLFDFEAWPGGFGFWAGSGARRRRKQMFESGEIKFVILRLLRDKPRHGYEIMKELEERFVGCYTPSAGTVYPTLQLLEDQGYVRPVEHDGKKVYHITPEGEQFLDQNQGVLDDILDRVRDTVRGFAGGRMGELHAAFSDLAKATYKRAWHRGPDHPSVDRVVEILRRAASEIRQEWERG